MGGWSNLAKKGAKEALRDYGLPDFGVVGRPKATKAIGEHECPNCGCEALHCIEVEVEVMEGTSGLGKYIGCPACPWASPMMVEVPKSGT